MIYRIVDWFRRPAPPPAPPPRLDEPRQCETCRGLLFRPLGDVGHVGIMEGGELDGKPAMIPRALEFACAGCGHPYRLFPSGKFESLKPKEDPTLGKDHPQARGYQDYDSDVNLPRRERRRLERATSRNGDDE